MVTCPARGREESEGGFPSDQGNQQKYTKDKIQSCKAPLLRRLRGGEGLLRQGRTRGQDYISGKTLTFHMFDTNFNYTHSDIL